MNNLYRRSTDSSEATRAPNMKFYVVSHVMRKVCRSGIEKKGCESCRERQHFNDLLSLEQFDKFGFGQSGLLNDILQRGPGEISAIQRHDGRAVRTFVP